MPDQRIHIQLLGKVALSSISDADVLALHVDEQDPVLVDSHDLERTIDAVKTRFPGAEITCSANLARFAESRAWCRVLPPDQHMRAERAALALQVTYGLPLANVRDRMLVASLVRATSRLASVRNSANRFWRASAHMTGSDGHSRLSLDVALIAATSDSWDQNNITVFQTRQEADDYYRSVTPWNGQDLPLRYLTFDLADPVQPDVREAVFEYAGTTRIPSAAAVDGGRTQSLSDLECAVLAASVFAIADLAEQPDRRDSTTYAAGQITLEATLTVEVNQIASGKYHGSMGWWQ